VMVAQFIIQVLVYPIVIWAGDGDKAVGFEKVMMVLAIVGVICLLITFLTTKERVIPKPEQESSVINDLKDLFGNRPWVVMLILTTLIFVTLALKGGSYIYYFEQYLDKEAMRSFLDSVGASSLFASDASAGASTFSLYNATSIICQIIGIFFSKRLADKYGKRNIFGGFLFLSTLFLLAYLVVPADAIWTVFALQIGHGLTYGVTIPILWAMIADVADYSEWKNNRRATAIIFSAMIFGLKVGLSIGGSLVAGLLAHYGYGKELATQSPETLNGIRLMISVFASLPFLIGVASLFFYEIDKKMETDIERDLLAGRGESVTE